MNVVRKIPRIGPLGQEKPERAPSFGKIAVRPGVPGAKVDPLEAAARQGVDGTLPERIIWKFLEDSRMLYTPQTQELGDRSAHGTTADFEIMGIAAMPVIVRIMGTYWHSAAFLGRSSNDDEQAARLRAAGYIVIDLEEDSIYSAVLNDRLGDFVMGAINAA